MGRTVDRDYDLGRTHPPLFEDHTNPDTGNGVNQRRAEGATICRIDSKLSAR